MNEKSLFVSIKEASIILDTSKGEVYKLVNKNTIYSIKENHRTLVYLWEINEIKNKRERLNKIPLKIRDIFWPGWRKYFGN